MLSACKYEMDAKKALCPDQDEEVSTKHIVDIKQFQVASPEPIPPLVGEPSELIDLNDELIEDPTVSRLSRKDTND